MAFTLCAVLVYVAFTRTRVGAVLVLWPSRSALCWSCGLHERFCDCAHEATRELCWSMRPSRHTPTSRSCAGPVAFTLRAVLVYVAFTRTRVGAVLVCGLHAPLCAGPVAFTSASIGF